MMGCSPQPLSGARDVIVVKKKKDQGLSNGVIVIMKQLQQLLPFTAWHDQMHTARITILIFSGLGFKIQS